MGLIAWIKDAFGFGEDDFDDIEYSYEDENTESLMESLANVSRRRRSLNINDRGQREQYVREYCDMMEIASKDVEAQKVEYQHVTERLADLDEIDKLPMTDRSKVRLLANKIIGIEDEQASYVRPSRKITEAQYREMDRLKDEMPGVIKKMREDEEYQMKVRRDLNLLEGEKGAVAYSRREYRAKARGARTFAFVSLFLTIMALVLLYIVDKTMKLDVSMGYLIALGLFALALTSVFVNYKNALKGIERSNKKLNKAISVQNTVKIKYVNITNVLDYNYAKYGVNNAYELEYQWEKYVEENNARNHDSQMLRQLDDARNNLYKLLKSYHINDPSVWVYQPGALVYDDEEKDIRKSLIVQRQRLKKGIDFEMYNLEAAKKEVQSLVTQYPSYAAEIIDIVDSYN